MFGLYLLGAVSAMLAAWVVPPGRDRAWPPGAAVLPGDAALPRARSLRSVLLTMWESALAFLRKVTTDHPAHHAGALGAAQPPRPLALPSSPRPASTRTTRPRWRPTRWTTATPPAIGRAVEPVFAPLGFDWRVNVGSARLAVGARDLRRHDGADRRRGEPRAPGRRGRRHDASRTGRTRASRCFTAPTLAALLVFFVYALQCMSTVAIMRRESGSWRWPAIAFGYMFVLAWTMGVAGANGRGAVMADERRVVAAWCPCIPRRARADPDRLRWVVPAGRWASSARWHRLPGRLGDLLLDGVRRLDWRSSRARSSSRWAPAGLALRRADRAYGAARGAARPGRLGAGGGCAPHGR